MSLFHVFDIAGSAMNAQNVRINTSASNLANAKTAAKPGEEPYRARVPVFETMLSKEIVGADSFSRQHIGGVQVKEIVQSDEEFIERYHPEHPYANEDGHVRFANVNSMQEMANMMAATQSFQNNIEIIQSTKQIMQRLLSLGQ